MRRSMISILAPAVAAAALSAPGEASAGIAVGAEADAAQGIGLPSGAHFGYGFAGALGYRIVFGPVFLQPEAQGSYFVFSGGTAPTHVARVMGGARFGLGRRIQPAIFAHAGVGWLSTVTSGRSVAAGVSLGFWPLRVLCVGAQAAFNLVSVPADVPTTRWVSYGVHVGVDF